MAVSIMPVGSRDAYAAGNIFEMSASITAPITGKTYDTSPMSGDQDRYTVYVEKESGKYEWYRGGSSAYSPGPQMSATETFKNGTVYWVTITFKAKAGYSIQAPEEDVKLNGRTGTCVAVNSLEGTRSYRFKFTAMDPVEAFVTRLYNICLEREPDASGFADWVSQLKSGSKTGIQVAKGFIFSKEFKDKNYCNTCFVKQLYRAFMGREYDTAGLNDWVTKITKGWKRQQIFNGFACSTEFTNICASYGITRGSKISIPWIETVIPTLYCAGCGADPIQIYDITYITNGGTMPDKTRYWFTCESADWVLPTPTRKGYIFNGWYKEAAHVNKVTKLPNGSTGSRTFYAKWTAIKYSVKFNANGGSGTMTNQTGIKYGTTVKLKANTFTRSGYTFNGWNRKADGSGTSYADKASVKNLASTEGGLVTLYAQWKKK